MLANWFMWGKQSILRLRVIGPIEVHLSGCIFSLIVKGYPKVHETHLLSNFAFRFCKKASVPLLKSLVVAAKPK